MKLLAHFIKLINDNNLAQLEADCEQLQLIQTALSPNKVKLFDYQNFIDQLIEIAARSKHDNPVLMEQLLQSNPSPLAILKTGWEAFCNFHSKQLAVLLQDARTLKVTPEDFIKQELDGRQKLQAFQKLLKALQQSQQELGWLQSNTNLIAVSLKESFDFHSKALAHWLDHLIEGTAPNPLNEKQWENFKKALRTLPDEISKKPSLDAVINSSQNKCIQDHANKLMLKLISQVKDANHDDDNVKKDWHIDVIWYIQNKEKLSESDIERKNKVLQFLIEYKIAIDFYLNNTLGIDDSLKNCNTTTVLTIFKNTCVERLQNWNNVIAVESDFTEMQVSSKTLGLAGFNDAKHASYAEILITNKDACDKIMKTVNEHKEGLKPFLNLIEIEKLPLICNVVRNASPYIQLFTEYYSAEYSEEVSSSDRQLAYNRTTILHQAVRFYPDAIDYFATLPKFNVNAVDGNRHTALHIAVKKNPPALVPLLRIQGINVNAVANGHSVLSMGQDNNPKDLQPLLDRADLNINVKRPDGSPVLHIALTQRQTLIVNALLTKKIDMTATDENGNTAQHIAAKYYPEAIEPLSKMPGFNVNARNKLNETPLHFAAASNFANAVPELLKIPGIDINAATTGGYTPLHTACYHNNKNALVLLQVPGIRLNKKTKTEGLTPLIIAFKRGNDLIEPLLNCDGTDVNVNVFTNGSLNTLVHMAIKSHPEFVAALLKKKGILVNTFDSLNRSPLDLAVELRNAVIPLLAQVEGFNPNLADSKGQTALHKAIYHYRYAINKLLALPGIDINIADNDGNTALPLAARHCDIQTLSLLLKAKGFDVNVRGYNRCTALHEAVTCRKKDLIIALLNVNGIDVNAQDIDGATPLHKAADHNPAAIELLLKAKGIKANLRDKANSTAVQLLYSNETKSFELLTKAIKKADESFTASNLIELCQLLANSKFLQVAKEQKYSKDFLDLGADDHFGRHLACDAFCSAINYCNTPTMLTFENWLVEQMKKVIELDVEMLHQFVTLVTTPLAVNPFTPTSWKKWVEVVSKAVGDKPSETLQKTLEAINNYRHPALVEKKLSVTSIVAVASVASTSRVALGLTEIETAAIKAEISRIFAKVATIEQTFDRKIINMLGSLASPNATASPDAALAQTTLRMGAIKWCEQKGVSELANLFEFPEKFVNNDKQRANLALNLLNESVLGALKALPQINSEENRFFANEELSAFVNARVEADELHGHELMEFK